MDSPLLGIAAVLLLGIGGQWLAWRIHWPGILVLLGLGLALPPFVPALNPETLLGDLFLPIVSVSIGLILFEGALGLRWREIQSTRGVLVRLVSIGALVNWAIITAAAWFILGFNVGGSLLMGAVLIVTGPTVIGPMLRHIRARGPSATVLKWEGIVIDPIGASLALIVLEALMAATRHEAAWGITLSVAATIASAALVGGVASWILWKALKTHQIPDHLQSPATLAIVVIALVAANAIQHESGLLAVTLMGAFFANQRSVAIGHIIEFKENIRVVLIACLFILLTARVPAQDLIDLGLPIIGFIAIIIFVARPLTVLVSTVRSTLTWKDKLFLMCLAPRGIVAASVASVFALALAGVDHVDAAAFTPTAFSVIIGTVLVYSLFAPLAARLLGLSESDPQGLLIVGAEPWCNELAQILKSKDIRVLIADTNLGKVRVARYAGLETYYGNVLSEEFLETEDLSGIGRCLAVTPNDEVNLLIARHLTEALGRSYVFRAAPADDAHKGDGGIAGTSTGRILFDKDMTSDYLTARLRSGDRIHSTPITDIFSMDDLRAQRKGTARLLAVVREGGALEIATGAAKPTPEAGDEALVLSAPEEDD